MESYAILFSSKFVIIELIDLIFRSRVEIDGFVLLMLLIITMIVTEQAIFFINDRLAGHTPQGALESS